MNVAPIQANFTITADQMNLWSIRIHMPEHGHDLILYPGQTYQYRGLYSVTPDDFKIRAVRGDSYWVEGNASDWAWGRYSGTEHPPGQIKLPLTFN